MEQIQKLQEELENTKIAYQMAVEISQFKSGFLGRISHELRAPLSSLMSSHQLILSDLCENQAEEREFIAQAQKTAEKLMKLLDEIITISKFEYGAIALKSEPIKLVEIFSKLAQFTERPAANKNLSLIIDQPASEIVVFADSERCFQGLLMLVDTAIDFLESGCIQVTVAIAEAANFAQITIDLTGELNLWEWIDKTETELPLQFTPLSSKNQNTSPYLKLLLVQSLFRKMGGDWQLLAGNSEKFIRLQGSIPLATC